MPNEENLKPFTSEYQPDADRKSRKGIPNGSTIARMVLEMTYDTPDEVFKTLAVRYPGLKKRNTIEFIGALQQADKMIADRDTQAYKALHDRAYGAPKQEIETVISEGADLKVWTAEEYDAFEKFRAS